MSLFVLAMVVGVLGLVLMALPGIHRGRGLRHAHGPRHGAGARHNLLPEPRSVLDVIALLGAIGNLLERATRWPAWLVALAALVPALALEALALQPLWKWALQFQGRPSSPLAALALEEARAVTPFRNGRGIVSLVRDGRTVQLPARLVAAHAAAPIRVGDLLQVQHVELGREWVEVALPGPFTGGRES